MAGLPSAKPLARLVDVRRAGHDASPLVFHEERLTGISFRPELGRPCRGEFDVIVGHSILRTVPDAQLSGQSHRLHDVFGATADLQDRQFAIQGVSGAGIDLDARTEHRLCCWDADSRLEHGVGDAAPAAV